MSGRSTSRRGRQPAPSRFARTARVNEVLRQVLAESIERLADDDARLGLATVTAVECDPDFRRATVLMSSLDPAAAEALEESRVRLQAAVAREVRIKHTPLLRFAADPAVAQGQRIEELLRAVPPATASLDESWRANYRDDASPDHAVPDRAVPDHAVPDHAVPGDVGADPGGAAPDHSAP